VRAHQLLNLFSRRASLKAIQHVFVFIAEPRCDAAAIPHDRGAHGGDSLLPAIEHLSQVRVRAWCAQNAVKLKAAAIVCVKVGGLDGLIHARVHLSGALQVFSAKQGSGKPNSQALKHGLGLHDLAILLERQL